MRWGFLENNVKIYILKNNDFFVISLRIKSHAFLPITNLLSSKKERYSSIPLAQRYNLLQNIRIVSFEEIETMILATAFNNTSWRHYPWRRHRLCTVISQKTSSYNFLILLLHMGYNCTYISITVYSFHDTLIAFVSIHGTCLIVFDNIKVIWKYFW